ncbi:MAG: hypothetical protein M1831_001901 [Alyxoria varia]|nr:MAG: hypothetical protein M1831_001901 [Alyxoria varia]
MEKIVEDDYADVDFDQFVDFDEAAAPLQQQQQQQQHHNDPNPYESISLDQFQSDLNALTSAPSMENPANQFLFDPTTGDPLQSAEQIDCDFNNVDDLYKEKYSSWIPRFNKPDPPCDYCQARQLDCKVFLWDREGRPNHACLSCHTLFRTCSFEEDSSHTHRGRLGQFDTLHVVTEDQCCETGALTGIKPLFSAGASLEQIMDDFADRKQDKPSGRFSKKIVKILKGWLEEHKRHPYPNEEEKEQLKDLTGLTRSQVSNWLANARRRGKCGRQPALSPSMAQAGFDQRVPLSTNSDAGASVSQPIPVPAKYSNGKEDHSDLTPFERWKESPPEHEPASVSAIARAMADTEYKPEHDSGNSSHTPSYAEHKRRSSAGGSGLHNFRTPSSTSIEIQSGISSTSFGSTSRSHGSSQGSSLQSFVKRNSRRRHNRKRAGTPIAKLLGSRHSQSGSIHSDGAKSSTHTRPFHCTFCTDTFQTKYDWQRHEKSLHLSLERWICAPEGPLTLNSAGGGTLCAYCGVANPSADHAETSHDHSTCFDKGLASRTFHRKDHLRQHLRLVHSVTKLPQHSDGWKTTRIGNGVNGGVKSRCGFCSAQLESWDERATHLAGHFRAGATMAQWNGSWGFDPEVEACVTQAIPPYLIAHESRTPLPFAAGKTGREQEMSNYMQELRSGSCQKAGVPHNLSQPQPPLPHHDEALLGTASDVPNEQNDSTGPGDFYVLFSQALAQRISKIQHTGSAQKRPITDAMIQEEARDLTFGSKDDWNQTEADIPAWLSWFKEKTGVRTIEDEAGLGCNTTGRTENAGIASFVGMSGAVEGPAFSLQSGHGYVPHASDSCQELLNQPISLQDMSIDPTSAVDSNGVYFTSLQPSGDPQNLPEGCAQSARMPDLISDTFDISTAQNMSQMQAQSLHIKTSTAPFSEEEAQIISALPLPSQDQETFFNME